MEEKKLILTTKGLYSNKYIVFWVVLVAVLAIVVVVRFAGLIIIPIVSGLFLGVLLVKNIGLIKSYIEIYDDHIEGLSMPKKIIGGLNEMHTFYLNYNEIISMSCKKNIVVINYNGGSYEVQAKDVEVKVVETIKKQQIVIGK